MSEPRETHMIEQSLAGAAAMGAMFAKMYLAMVNEGVPPLHAAQITASYANGIARPREP